LALRIVAVGAAASPNRQAYFSRLGAHKNSVKRIDDSLPGAELVMKKRFALEAQAKAIALSSRQSLGVKLLKKLTAFIGGAPSLAGR
jgi:hypothetical protein